MRRAIRSLVLPALCAFSATAFAQYDADLERPQSGSPNPEGRPPSFRAWAPLSYYIWHDAGGWHLRSTTSGHFHQFQGQVQAPEGVYNVRSTDPRTPLQIMGNSISFSYSVQGGERGFDWSGGGAMIFNLTVDGRDRPEKVRIGYGEERPYPGAVQLYPGGGGAPEAMAAPPPEDDTADMENAEGPEMDEGAFHDVLSPYGQWVGDPEYGTVWRPYEQVVGGDFEPYTNGHWVYTELGWSWESAYDWGWAPFHYGNWVWTAGSYWGWVPGRVWAPAWVSWRYGDGYVGWAPIAPYGHRTVIVEPRHYTYVEVGGFQSGGAYRRDVIITGPRAERIHGRTTELASASYVGGHAVVPVHAGPSPTVIGHASGHAVVPVQSTSLQHASPPQNQHGVHYAGGATASHPFAARQVPQAEAKQYVAAQPKAAQAAFHEHVAATRGGIQPGHALPTTPVARPAPAANTARPATNERPAQQMNERPAANAHPAQMNERPAQNAHPAQMNERPATNVHPAQMNERPAANERGGAPQMGQEHSQPQTPPQGQPQNKAPPPQAKPKQNQPEKKH